MSSPDNPARAMRNRAFAQVDVFPDTAYRGNPVAVVLDAKGIDAAEMQAIARWTNLSETVFVLPATSPEADYRLRIFTPGGELPFAGHPTLGTAHALLESGLRTKTPGVMWQECAAGLVRIDNDASGSPLWLTMPPAASTPLDEAAQALLARALGTRASGALRIDLGPVWIVARLDDARSVLELAPEREALRQLSKLCDADGVTVFGEHRSEGAAHGSADPAPARPLDRASARYEIRSFAPRHGIDEDPVCGSGNGCVAAYLAERGERADYVARQGAAIGRDGVIAVRYNADATIAIGGKAVTRIRGEILA